VTCIWRGPSSILGLDTDCPDRVFYILCRKYCHDNFLFDVYFKSGIHVSTACSHLQAILVTKCESKVLSLIESSIFTIVNMMLNFLGLLRTHSKS
jgi:hypothetical protein